MSTLDAAAARDAPVVRDDLATLPGIVMYVVVVLLVLVAGLSVCDSEATLGFVASSAR
ncbi:hypothetical protein Micbo1qcDRAFT_166222 [Microdochium bolleyi]|uniref:Uncharacterized protein n=1 Tax=Microdochium bolleyi TaxID=196109 RepID=A0A136IV50_9PEZI|nr:hypothetical protein Micbo1qcDRAFT_166222 [Microdochium bolleyi]